MRINEIRCDACSKTGKLNTKDSPPQGWTRIAVSRTVTDTSHYVGMGGLDLCPRCSNDVDVKVGEKCALNLIGR